MSDYTSWHVGMKVAYVGGTTHFSISDRFFGLVKRRVPHSLLTIGDEFTITAIGEARDRATGETAIGITISPDRHNHDGSYPAKCFRPVQSPATDISIFERIRDNPKAPIIEPSPKQRERV